MYKSSMPAYMLLQIAVTDRERFSAYSKEVVPLIAEFGGNQIVRGAKAEVLEGHEPEGLLATFEFLTIDALHTFWNSPRYMPVKELRRDAGRLHAWAAGGLG